LRAKAVRKKLLAAACVLGTASASAQSYPTKPIRIVTNEPGGGLDFALRVMTPALSSGLGQQVIVDNRGGAGGVIAADIVAKASPDGYTLLYYSNGIWTLPLLQKVPYDFVRDFTPVTLAASSPNILVVHPSLPVNSVAELIALAKAKPGTLNYASGGRGAPTHLAAELFKSMAGVDIVHIPYKGSGPALISLIGGHEQLMFTVAVGGLVHVKAGRLKPLAVTSAKPSALLPGLPTVAASGLPGYESVSIQGLFAPAKTPAAVVQRLQHQVVRVVARAEVKEKFFNAGTEVVGSTPAEFAAAVQADMTAMAKVIQAAGIRAD